MSPLNHKRTTSSVAPPIICVAKKWQLKDRRLPINNQRKEEGIEKRNKQRNKKDRNKETRIEREGVVQGWPEFFF